VIVAKRQRRLSSIDEIVLSLYARGLPPATSLRNCAIAVWSMCSQRSARSDQ
jgi:hypothetical protein